SFVWLGSSGAPQPDEIMQQDIRPLVAVDIIEQLHRQFAILSGGRGTDGAPIITFPEYAGFSDIPDEDFLNVVTYLTSIPSLEAASIGFIIIIDRRRDKWSAVKASLTRIAVTFPGNLQLVFVLRPSRFIQRTIADIGIKLYRDDFKMKVPIIMLNSVSDLHGYIDKSQLTRELGGTLEYGHSQWIHHRTAIENFAMTVKTTAQMLQTFGTDLAETELPNDVQCTEELLASHMEQHDKLKDELRLAVKQGATLLTCIREPVTRSANSKLSPDELENVATVERWLLAQLDETEKAFDQFWFKHHLKLDQCLQLRHFEQDFREIKLALDNLMEVQAGFIDIGESVSRVEHLLKEQKQLEEKGQEPLEKAQSLAVHGDQLIQNNHYAVDSIRPKCVELRRICDDFTNETKKKYDILGKSLELHKQLDKASQWCEAGIYLLASQAVDKCQSQEGAETALSDIERFLGTAKDHQLSNPKEFYNQFDLILTPEIKSNAQKVLQKLEDVQEMFDKRQVSLKKLAAKQTRPVQPVAPHPESSPKRASPKSVRPAALGSHIINELIETERVYVEELQSIIEGYASEMDNPALFHLIPAALQNKKEVLFGNLPEIYEFHNRHVLHKPYFMCPVMFLSVAMFFLLFRLLQECQRKLDHKLSLDAYLLKPVQRITKYQLLLKIEFNSLFFLLLPHTQQGDVHELGKLLLQGSFNVWTDHKKGHNKVKDLARFKPMQRHLFLYAKILLFCKKREESTDGHEKSPSYSFKNSLKVKASSIEFKNTWVSEIRKVLTGQLEACRGRMQYKSLHPQYSVVGSQGVSALSRGID
uniref:MCF.2 cell line derived transforming sequence-like 2 n=1 Tax=Sphenodon punctatus TaxID=8508 RepID=A0A8D0LA13_SPHPU